MGRLIDADNLKAYYAWWNNEDKEVFDCIVDLQPTVDDVKHAYWKDTKFSYGECSECGEWTDHYTTARYCVHCGAKMDVVKV